MDQLAKLQKIIEHADKDFIQKDEFKTIFDFMVSVLKEMRKYLEGEMTKSKKETITTTLFNMDVLEKKMTDMMKSKCSMADMKEALKGVMKDMKRIEETIPTMPDLKVYDSKLNEFKATITGITPEIDRKLDDLYAEMKKYIDSRPKVETSSRPIFGGRVGMQIYDSTGKVGLKAIELAFGPGLSVYELNGRITVASMASGAVLTATGDCNGVNTVFTFTSKPNYIVIDNVSYRETSKNGVVYWTWDASTLTATLLGPPPTTNGDIFGVK